MRLLIFCIFLFSIASHAAVATSNSDGQRTSESALRADASISGKSNRKPFTQKQKTVVKQQNAEENDGKNNCENCGTETVPAKKHVKGVTPPLNETHVDHVIPQAKGGKSETDNGQVLCRDCNIKKGDKLPTPGSEK